MELTRDLRVSIAANRSDWLRSWSCIVICFEEISICLNEHHPGYNSLFDLQYPDRETAASQISCWAEKIQQETGHRAAVWLDRYCEPEHLNLLLPDLGFRLASTSYTLAAKTEDVETRKPVNIPIWRIKTGGQKAWIDAYSHAFGQVEYKHDFARWAQAFDKQQHVELQFYLGFRRSAVLGGSFPGQPAVVGQIITAHGAGGIYSIGTVPKHRRKGFASEMVAFLATVAGQAELQHVYVVTSNPGFFEKLGFTVAFQTAIWEQI
ncbi:MAG: hypothetical protein A2Z42_04875 [Candidatus Woykebacteria bacterium RBG_19FT_COMBO_43_10]|uniref:N-acetyltransferase domain-containing protein n=1 Tax=Candidatus Woykebacteria bacterium RBG_19FT_COMBO_43_10 TaxID=1802598 RepID=A0A1G1WGM0_9BACT|nr:MAG: hypothetical protein A2Z42_04875 [Candidatus Woykebacteria bacterium RBG_19FT_COMBO_43_10]